MLCKIVELTVNVAMTVLLRSTVMLVKAGNNVTKMHICLAVYSTHKNAEMWLLIRHSVQ